MRFTWSETKRALNIQQHGLDFVDAQKLWAEFHVVIAARTVEGEKRWGLVARLDGGCWVAIFTMRGENVRLFSCHRADSRWERHYEDREKKKDDS